jgi:23S rRNA pseudouridine2605 synthase
MKNRLSKVLAAIGIASRRAAEELIFEGRVQVNGVTILIPQTLVSSTEDTIQVDGEIVGNEPEKVYYILNKPEGYICSNVRPGKKPIVFDLFPHEKRRLFTIGRLDRDTQGLLLVTNDGAFAQKVIHPSANIKKEYIVKTAQEITQETLEILSRGARVDHRWVKPVFVQKIRKGNFRICVKEGRKHEVRILAEKARLEVLELTRIRIGSLTLGTLPIGSFRELSEKDKELLFARE